MPLTRVEAYRCDKCRGVIIAPEAEAQAHYDAEIDTPFKVGFVFYDRDKRVYRITGKGGLSQDEDPKYVHGWEQDYSVCPTGKSIFESSISSLSDGFNSKLIRVGLARGEYSLVDVATAKKLRKANRCVIHRTDPSLEARTK